MDRWAAPITRAGDSVIRWVCQRDSQPGWLGNLVIDWGLRDVYAPFLSVADRRRRRLVGHTPVGAARARPGRACGAAAAEHLGTDVDARRRQANHRRGTGGAH